MTTEPVVAWAVIDDDAIKVRTVSDTQRAAMVNWLVTECGCMIYSYITDEQIEHLWLQKRRQATVEIVTIRRGAPS
jgi:hypothetical protein